MYDRQCDISNENYGVLSEERERELIAVKFVAENETEYRSQTEE